MAARAPNEGPSRPEVGDTLIVIRMTCPCAPDWIPPLLTNSQMIFMHEVQMSSALEKATGLSSSNATTNSAMAGF